MGSGLRNTKMAEECRCRCGGALPAASRQTSITREASASEAWRGEKAPACTSMLLHCASALWRLAINCCSVILQAPQGTKLHLAKLTAAQQSTHAVLHYLLFKHHNYRLLVHVCFCFEVDENFHIGLRQKTSSLQINHT